MARAIANGRITNAKGNFTRGDAIEGSEADLRPLVESGSARWEDEEAETWTLGMSPSDYLDRYPEGPNAELARTTLSAEDTDDEEGD